MEGIVRQIRPLDETVVVAHEDVPGFMPAMTMPFNVRDRSILESLEVGRAIEFEFVTESEDSWIRNVSEIALSEVKLPEKNFKAPFSGSSAASQRLEEGDAIPDFALVDQDGEPIDRATFAGQDLVLTFIFTSCGMPEFCPRMSRHFDELEDRLAEIPELASQVRLLSISIDPETDTPEVMKEYAASYGRETGNDRWRLASGSQEQTDALTKAFAVYTETADGTINHGLTTGWIGPDGTVREIWRGSAWEPGDILQALQSGIAKENNNQR
jgi:protein SCO1/2